MDDLKPKTAGHWIGPFRLRDYLERCIDPDQEWPPEAAGVYVVSRLPWAGQPSDGCGVLYVGSNPNAPIQFRNRIGFLVKDMLGFWGDIAYGSHSGGQSIWNWCFDNKFSPLDLYLGWIIGIECGRCVENELYARFCPKLSRKAPAQCTAHVAS
jgi:hypothetical protein